MQKNGIDKKQTTTLKIKLHDRKYIVETIDPFTEDPKSDLFIKRE